MGERADARGALMQAWRLRRGSRGPVGSATTRTRAADATHTYPRHGRPPGQERCNPPLDNRREPVWRSREPGRHAAVGAASSGIGATNAPLDASRVRLDTWMCGPTAGQSPRATSPNRRASLWTIGAPPRSPASHRGTLPRRHRSQGSGALGGYAPPTMCCRHTTRMTDPSRPPGPPPTTTRTREPTGPRCVETRSSTSPPRLQFSYRSGWAISSMTATTARMSTWFWPGAISTP